jgi:hypothetical protein
MAVGAYGWQPHRYLKLNSVALVRPLVGEVSASYLWADYPENVGASTSENRMGLHDLVQG